MDLFDSGDPYIEWNEEISAREDYAREDYDDDDINLGQLPEAYQNKFKRITEVKQYTKLEALQYVISAAWILEIYKAQTGNEVELSTKGCSSMELDKLKSEVLNELISVYDFDFEGSESIINKSVESRSDLWHENAQAKDLAEMLASDEDDD
jgi:hypothetical protein